MTYQHEGAVMADDRLIHVLHVTEDLGIGGLQSFIVELCRKADSSRFRMSVLCLIEYDPHYREMLGACGVHVYLISKRGKFDLAFFFRVASLLRTQQVNILHAHGGCFFYAAIFRLLAGIPSLIFTAHGMPILHGLQQRCEEFVSCLVARRLVAVSLEIAEDFTSRLAFFTKKVIVILNGVDTGRFTRTCKRDEIVAARKRFGIPPERPLVGSVGRLEQEKNYSLLISSVADLATRGVDVHLALVGQGTLEWELREHAESLGIADRVSFLGMQYDLPLIYRMLDLFVLSSFTEGTSLSLLEAQSCGIPAVVTNVGGNPEIVADGKNGLLFSSGDQQALTLALERLFRDRRRLETMGAEAARLVAERFSMEAIVGDYQSLYQGMAG